MLNCSNFDSGSGTDVNISFKSCGINKVYKDGRHTAEQRRLKIQQQHKDANERLNHASFSSPFASTPLHIQMTSDRSVGIRLIHITVFCLCLLRARLQRRHPPPPRQLTFHIQYTMSGKGHRCFGFSLLVLLYDGKSPRSLRYINISMLLSKACKGQAITVHFQ